MTIVNPEVISPSGTDWGEYIRRGCERGVQGRIIESWQRCGQVGLNPYERNIPVPAVSSQFKKRLQENLEIVELYQFYIRRFSGLLEQLGACSFVCDTDGFILSRAGFGIGAELLRRFLALRRKFLLRTGDRDERPEPGPHQPANRWWSGPTNITRRTYHPAFCAASPILDEDTGISSGCVDVHEVLRPQHLRGAPEASPEPGHLPLRHDPQRSLSRAAHEVVPGVSPGVGRASPGSSRSIEWRRPGRKAAHLLRPHRRDGATALQGDAASEDVRPARRGTWPSSSGRPGPGRSYSPRRSTARLAVRTAPS